jgi:hypothetical protein
VLLSHFSVFVIIYFFKDAYLTDPQKNQVALSLLPVSAAYLLAVVKSAIERQSNIGSEMINLNYAVIILSFTFLALFGLVFTVVDLRGTTPKELQLLSVFEIAFGTIFGLIVSDLFGKVEISKDRGPQE